MTRPLLTVEHLVGGYGDVGVIDGVDISVGEGQVCCVTGRNGVGKTTLMRLVTGSLIARAGRVSFSTHDVTKLAPSVRRRLGMSYAPQEQIVFDTLTVAENLTLHHDNRSLARYDAIFDRFPRLKERLGQKAGTLSGGEKKILSFCRAFAEGNPLTILDEPTEGVQPENIAHMGDFINLGKAEGRSFLVVEQNLSLVEKIADTVHFIDHGSVIFSSPFESDTRKRLQSLMML